MTKKKILIGMVVWMVPWAIVAMIAYDHLWVQPRTLAEWDADYRWRMLSMFSMIFFFGGGFVGVYLKRRLEEGN